MFTLDKISIRTILWRKVLKTMEVGLSRGKGCGGRESREKNNKTLSLFPSVNCAERQTYNGSGKAFRIHAKDASHKISDMIMKTNQVRIFLTLSSWKKVVL